MSQHELQQAYERYIGSQGALGRPEALLAAARRRAAQEWLGGTVEGLTALQVDEILELACRDASCAPPPVGTGGSKPAGASGDVATILRRGTTAERVAFAESLFNHELPHGFTAWIESDQFEDGILANPKDKIELFAEGKIRDRDGGYAGHFERHIELKPDGTLVAHHDTLVINPDFQGMGLAQSFTSQSIDAYKKIGVKHIEVDAAMQVGAFAWARQGYQFEPKHEAIRKQWVEDRLLWVKKVADEGTKDKWSLEDAAQMRKAAQDLINASNRGEPVQPIHVASLGEQRYRWTKTDVMVDDDGRTKEVTYETWPGKEVLLAWNQANPDYGKPYWRGVKYLDGQDESVAAAATEIEEFYSPSQPRAKDGKWTRLGGYGSTTDSVGITGYEGEELKNAEHYKYHGPRHVADSMDPELRATVTADLLTRKVAADDKEWAEFLVRARDLGLAGESYSMGVLLQISHLYEAINDPNAVGSDWVTMDKVRGLIDEYDRDLRAYATTTYAAYVTKLHDDIAALTGVDATTGLLGAVNRSWQISSSDTISVAAHLTVAKTHGIDDARETMDVYMRDDRLEKADAMIANIGEDNLKAITDATYAVTQRELARLFPDEPLTVFRGVADGTTVMEVGHGNAWVKPSPLSSWSTSSGVAEDFSAEEGWLMEIKDVPHESIYSFATITGMGSLIEQEVILIGHERRVTAFRANDPAWYE